MQGDRDNDSLVADAVKEYEPVLLSDLYVRDPELRKLVRLEPNEVQVAFLDKNWPMWRTEPIRLRGCREIILKARQQGFSTLIEALIFCDTINNGNTYSLVVGAKRESSENLFRMTKIFYDKLPPEKKRPTKYSSKRELYWEDINSSMYVGSAEVGDTGRGSTINNLHLTEIPTWPNPEELIAAVMEAVPEIDGFVALESTANGMGDWFHTTWLESTANKNNYRPTFSPWFATKRYRYPVPPDFKRTDYKHPKYGNEAELAELHGLDDEQLMWRRRKINTLKEKFPQEHPATPEEAFLVSGNPYYDREKLQQRMNYLIANPPTEIEERPDGGIRLKALSSEFVVYKLPETGKAYVIGADVSEGLNTKGTDHDYSSADVLDEDGEQVATLHGRWTPREFGLMLAELGRWYNTALLGIERNNHGHAALDAVLYTAGYPEQKGTGGTGVYMHQDFDINRIPTTRRPGYPTTTSSKALCDDDLAAAIDDNEILINSRPTVDELMRYVKLPGGKAGGAPHDDRQRSLAIARQMWRLRPRKQDFDIW